MALSAAIILFATSIASGCGAAARSSSVHCTKAEMGLRFKCGFPTLRLNAYLRSRKAQIGEINSRRIAVRRFYHAMVDSIVKLLEKLVKLGEVRATNKQLYVDRYATPLYAVAETVYKDYSSLLRDVRRKIQTGRKIIPLIQFLERRRVDQLATRLRIRATLRKTPEKNWTRFEQGILGLIHGCISDSDRYLSIYPVEVGSLNHTVYDIIRRIEHYQGDEPLAHFRHDLLGAVERQIAGLDKAWEFVCAGYADLQSTAVPDVAVPSKYVYKRSGD